MKNTGVDPELVLEVVIDTIPTQHFLGTMEHDTWQPLEVAMISENDSTIVSVGIPLLWVLVDVQRLRTIPS